MNTPGQSPPNPPQAPGNDRLAITSLVCGIAGIVLCLGPLSGVVAIVCGHIASSRIAKSGGTLGGAGMAVAGLILGYFSFAWIVVMAVLMSLLFPAVTAVKENTRRLEAKNNVLQLVTATKQYHAEYDRFPLSPANGDTDLSPENGTLLDVLRARDEQENPRGIVFFESREDRFRGSALVDPWGQPYRIVLDTNGDNLINVGGETPRTPVAVWSIGKNGRDESGEGDDIPSWK